MKMWCGSTSCPAQATSNPLRSGTRNVPGIGSGARFLKSLPESSTATRCPLARAIQWSALESSVTWLERGRETCARPSPVEAFHLLCRLVFRVVLGLNRSLPVGLVAVIVIVGQVRDDQSLQLQRVHCALALV